MPIHLIPYLSDKNIVLASKSPRRIEILQNLGLKFEVLGSDFPETLDKSQFKRPEDYVTTNAMEKAKEVLERLKKSSKFPDIVIGADTIVVHHHPNQTPSFTILEKAEDPAHAVSMLKSLRDSRVHSVYTGVCLFYRSKSQDENEEYRCKTFVEETKVTFGKLPDEVIASYVDTGDGLDKAGSYGYQSLGAFLISKIDGCYYNVVGLPSFKLFQVLSEMHQNKQI
ncbi:Maf-like protein [Paraphysoderma sedebokerense]|nr:Maf-like protein [Paraphysoderma sedebokerense]